MSRTSLKTLSSEEGVLMYKHLIACLACLDVPPRIKDLQMGIKCSRISGNFVPNGCFFPMNVKIWRTKAATLSMSSLIMIKSSFMMSRYRKCDGYTKAKTKSNLNPRSPATDASRP